VLRRALTMTLVLGALSAGLGGLSASPARASSWCGTPGAADRAPQLFGGPQVHTVYVHPSDGADRLATFADAIQTNAESIDAWWRGQDATRAPRFDLFPFACGPQLDLAGVQLTVTGASIADGSSAYGQIGSQLQETALLTPDDDALVYYDGPETNTDLCGIGGGGLAVVFVNACTDVDSARVAAHELGHALGAVDDGAPHRCPDSGHTCDNAADLMYPFVVPGQPLAVAILDPGRDDYYGHSGGWVDVQDSPFLKHADAQVHLTVGITGAGHVTSDPVGVDCSAACALDWDAGSAVTLSAAPGNGLRFVRWGGACSGQRTDACELTLGSSTSISAFFAPARFRLAVSVSGRGRVVSKPAGIACSRSCRHAFTSYRPVRLTAKPAKGWRFRAWSGACRGARPTCTVPMKAAAGIRAVFARKHA
jgi:List-Bact-rpt repeat protein